MKILFVQWANFGKEDITEAFTKMGHEVIPFEFPNFMQYHVTQELLDFNKQVEITKPDLVFSSNYSPNVSAVCFSHSIPYAAWVYDSPQLNTFSATLVNPTNYVFLFDSEDYATFINAGINTVYYLPLAANTIRMSRMVPTSDIRKRLNADISFVGRMYTEEEDQFKGVKNVNDFTKGYLAALKDAQQMVSGVSFIEPLIKGDILDELRRTMPFDELANNAIDPAYVYSRYFIEKDITRMERKNLIRKVSDNFQTRLYTPRPTPDIPNAINMGSVHPYKELPYVFKCSKININISLRSIHSGIPLRSIEVMGAGAFLLSNFQKDYLMFFEPDKDFVYYEDEYDLIDKCRYYLEHDKERNSIATNGYNKVREHFSYEVMLQNILDTIFQ